jgi:hypothetical protein
MRKWKLFSLCAKVGNIFLISATFIYLKHILRSQVGPEPGSSVSEKKHIEFKSTLPKLHLNSEFSFRNNQNRIQVKSAKTTFEL